MSRLPAKLASIALASFALLGCDARHAPIHEWAPTPSIQHEARPLPKGSFEGSGKSLLDSYADRTARDSSENTTWTLPNNSKTIIVESLIAAALDDPARMQELLTPEATWGTPDRRQLREHPVFTADDPWGLGFITALRNSAARFKAKAKFKCVPLQPNFSLLAESGAEPMWCSYTADDGYDLLVFRLVKYRSQLKIGYVGLFVERPTGPTYVPNAGFAPPATPYTKIDPSEMPKPVFGRGPGAQSRPRPRPAARPPQPTSDAPIPVQADRQPDRPIAVEAEAK